MTDQRLINAFVGNAEVYFDNQIPTLDVLDKGYVRLTDFMGSDASIVNAARVSFDKECTPNEDGSLKERDVKLIKYLINNNERSVLRHATLQFEMYMPLFICRQYWKYIVAVANINDGVCMNESSRRYITEVPTFHIPEADQWRTAPDNKKQGSGVVADDRLGAIATQQLMEHVDKGVKLYEYWNSVGFAPEQTRLFLTSYGMYVRIRSTMSLAALVHLLEERLDGHAQSEFQVYARAMRDLTKPLFPSTFEALGL